MANTEYVAECLWPDVHESDVQALDQRAAEQAERVAEGGAVVEYLGSILMREDEVVLCLFRGGFDSVREVAIAAEIPFDRILEATRSPFGVRQQS